MHAKKKHARNLNFAVRCKKAQFATLSRSDDPYLVPRAVSAPPHVESHSNSLLVHRAMISVLSPEVLIWATCTSAIFSVTIVLIELYNSKHEIDSMAIDVYKELENFKDSTNAAWIELMDTQRTFSDHFVTKRNIVQRDIFLNMVHNRKNGKKQKRYDTQLPAWCQCEALKPQCPRGPQGPPGRPGIPGSLEQTNITFSGPGRQGIPGRDNHESQSSPSCHIFTEGCVRCPAGPPGPQGEPGYRGITGRPGKPGLNGAFTMYGPPGKSGSQGNPGKQGYPGLSGKAGTPGRSAVRAVGRRGPPGVPGFRGAPGKRGIRGEDGKPGLPGAMGQPGNRGRPGFNGNPGRRGPPGTPSGPGDDAGYCPCPKRNKKH